MSETRDSDFVEASLYANANRQVIGSLMAEVIRDLMRALSSDHDTGYKASEKMNFVVDMLRRCEEPLSWHQLFSDAIAEMRESLPVDSFDKEYIRLAKRGVKYFVESSATDSAAPGRASRRQNEFRDSIRHIEAAKVEARKTPSRAQQEAWAEMEENAKNLGKLK